MHLNTDHLAHLVRTLEISLKFLNETDPESIEYEIFRNAVVKGFELTLETSAKLIRKAIKAYTGRPRDVDAMTFRDVFRSGAKHGLVSTEGVNRWFAYRDNRNNTAHDYGAGFARETMELLPGFIEDARTLEASLRRVFGNDHA